LILIFYLTPVVVLLFIEIKKPAVFNFQK